MPDNLDNGGGQDSSDVTDPQKSQADKGAGKGTTQNPQNQNQGGGGNGQAPETFDREYVEKLRKEAADNRVKAQQATTALEAAQNKDLTEAQKMQRQLDDITQKNKEMADRVRKADIIAAASKANARYPEVLAALVPPDADDIDAAVRELKKKYPDMFKPVNGGSADGGAGVATGKGESMNDWLRTQARGGR